jgi:6-phosphofructokinase
MAGRLDLEAALECPDHTGIDGLFVIGGDGDPGPRC